MSSDATNPLTTQWSTSGDDLLFSIAANLILGFILLVLFFILRSLKSMQWCFNPTLVPVQVKLREQIPLRDVDHDENKRKILWTSSRGFGSIHRSPVSASEVATATDDYFAVNEKYKCGFFSFFMDAIEFWNKPDEEVRFVVGIDGVFLLRLAKLGARYFTILTIAGLFILIPVNSAGRSASSGSLMERMSMANIPDGSGRLWVHLIANITFFVILAIMLRKEYAYFVKFRRDYFLKSVDNPSNFTILMENIPKDRRNAEELKQFLVTECKIDVEATQFVEDSQEIDTLYFQRDKILDRITILKYSTSESLIDSATAQKLAALENEKDALEEKIAEISNQPANFTGTAIIVCKNLRSVNQLLRIPIFEDPLIMMCKRAPSPSDIIMTNLRCSQTNKSSRSAIIQVSVFLLIVFYMLPITLISTLSSISTLSRAFPSIQRLPQFALSLLEGFLPTILIRLFQSLLPLILTVLTYVEKIPSHSEAQIGTFRKYFWFQFFNFYLASTFTSSIIQVWEEIIRSPSQIVNLLSRSLPQYSSFFINYIILLTLVVIPIYTLRIAQLFLHFFFKFILRFPQPILNRFHLPVPFPYGAVYPLLLLVFIVCMTYSTLAPLILPFGMIYFLCTWFLLQYMLRFIHQIKYETGGTLTSQCIFRLLLGASVAQLTMVGYFSLKKGYPQSVFMMLLFMATAAFTIYLYNRYASVENHLAIQESNAVDHREQVDVSGIIYLYFPPKPLRPRQRGEQI